jgi:polyhydroxyalkanoate synthesis regulator phasin
MNELIKILSELINSGKVTENLNVKVVDDGEGNITIKYTSPKNTPVVRDIKEKLQDMDDDIFTQSAEYLMEKDRKSYEVMANLETTTDFKALEDAYNVFKECVHDVVNDKIASLEKEISRLEEKYLIEK